MLAEATQHVAVIHQELSVNKSVNIHNDVEIIDSNIYKYFACRVVNKSS